MLNFQGGKDMTPRPLATAALDVALALPAGAFQRGPRFGDNDGDLIADIPTDPSER